MAFKRILSGFVLTLLVGSFLAVSGCAGQKASTACLAGDQGCIPHERHNVGLDSQVSDY